MALAVQAGETPRRLVAQIADGLAIDFAVTPLGAIFGLVASGLWIFAGLYSVGYMRGAKEKHQTRFAAFYAVAVHAAMAIAWSGNLLVLFVFYEILTFSTYPLVTHKESQAARDAGRLIHEHPCRHIDCTVVASCYLGLDGNWQFRIS